MKQERQMKQGRQIERRRQIAQARRMGQLVTLARAVLAVLAVLVLIMFTACSDDNTVLDAGTDGSTVDDATVDGPARDSSAVDGPAPDGPAVDGPAADGSTPDDQGPDGPWTADGFAPDGAVADGHALDSLGLDGTVASGWPMQFGGGDTTNTLAGMGRDGSGNLYIAGSVSGSAVLGTSTVASGGFVAKLDPAGSFAWAAQIGTGTSVAGLAVDAAGNCHIAGNLGGPATIGSTTLAKGGFVAKLSPSGVVLWAAQVSFSAATSDEGELTDVAVDSTGHSYVTGHVEGSVAFGSVSLTSSHKHAVVAKLSPSGVFLWASPATSTGPTAGTSSSLKIAVDGVGSSYITGLYKSGANGVSFGSTLLTANTLGNAAFVAKLDSSGAFAWAASGSIPGTPPSFWGGGATGLAIAVDGSGGSYVSGSLDLGGLGAPAQATAQFGSVSATVLKGSWMFVAKVSASGTFDWLKTWKVNGSTPTATVAVDSAGDIYLSGRAGGGSGTGTQDFPLPGNARAYVLKLGSDGAFKWIAAPVIQPNITFRPAVVCVLGSAGTSYVAGTFRQLAGTGSATFGSKTLTPPPTFFAAKVSATGSF